MKVVLIAVSKCDPLLLIMHAFNWMKIFYLLEEYNKKKLLLKGENENLQN